MPVDTGVVACGESVVQIVLLLLRIAVCAVGERLTSLLAVCRVRAGRLETREVGLLLTILLTLRVAYSSDTCVAVLTNWLSDRLGLGDVLTRLGRLAIVEAVRMLLAADLLDVLFVRYDVGVIPSWGFTVHLVFAWDMRSSADIVKLGVHAVSVRFSCPISPSNVLSQHRLTLTGDSTR